MLKINGRQMVHLALLITLQIVLSKFLSITTPVVRIGFAFLPVAVAGMMYGPVWGSIMAVIADLLGVMLMPSGGFFPGFTLSAFVGGAVYGIFLYRHPASFIRILCAVIFLTLFVHLGMNTLWIQMMTGKGYLAVLPPRLLQNAIMFPIQVFLIYLVGMALSNVYPELNVASQKIGIDE